MNNWAIIVAAGKSERFGDKMPKQFQEVAGKPLLAWTISAFEKAGSIDQIVVVVSEEFQLFVTQKVIDPFKFSKVCKIVSGGKNRQESVYNALKSLPKSAKVVAIHDGVRPLVQPGDIDSVVVSAAKYKAAILAVPARETVKEVDGDSIATTLPREKIWLAQTPQAFEYELILNAHEKSVVSGYSDCVTDDSLLVEEEGVSVRVIEPSSVNIKVTTLEDMSYVELVLRKGQND